MKSIKRKIAIGFFGYSWNKKLMIFFQYITANTDFYVFFYMLYSFQNIRYYKSDSL